MAKLVKKKTTTTVTEEYDIYPEAAGKEIGHRFMTVHEYDQYCARMAIRCQNHKSS